MLKVIALQHNFEKLRVYLTENRPDFGDGDSVLTLLYEAYTDNNRMDDDRIKGDFNELYQKMSGMTLTQMDTIFDLVFTPCRDCQRSGFVDGIKVGILLRTELAKK